ncbi:MAG TPA: ABC transporter ATP-binding protein [Desulfatiglandales bacterium]|nr:ABC transporter ATP-binding protein [Desulfatiglandales bacterium]
MTEALLEIRNLHTYFRTDEGLAKAVNGVDLIVPKGQTLGLVGESGCGKSVTALSIMRLIPDPPGRIVGGEIIFEGRDLLKLTEPEMRMVRGNTISMIFQEPMTALNPVYKIGSQMAEVIQLHQKVGKAGAMDRALEMLNKVGIADPERRLDEYPHEISGGMRQRVLIAMALSSHPKLVIADEPTTALDVTIQAQILDLINALKDEMGTSNLLITHDLGVIFEMAQWVAVMYAGKVVEYASVDDLFGRPLHPYTGGLVESILHIDQAVSPDKMLKTIPGMVPSLFEVLEGCSFQDRCNHAFDRCRSEEPHLVDVNSGHLVRCWLHE